MKINSKILFILFAMSVFFIGFVLSNTINDGLKSGTELYWQLSRLVPFIISAFVFGNKIYTQKAI